MAIRPDVNCKKPPQEMAMPCTPHLKEYLIITYTRMAAHTKMPQATQVTLSLHGDRKESTHDHTSLRTSRQLGCTFQQDYT